ncbi:hypothetical protein NDU88_000129 [Pleurodeles waltl]|uniref:Uncharacterized protein n=1 Tax=Pleurodeles waltl TaxID=8319 RepID=A0AAV7MIT8_PLEWA|nr:hypothetical protein NDU88_000129 [Pleurodeles waltl]
MQKMSYGVKIVADMISCWKAPISLGYDKSVFFIKMALDGPRRDLWASTLGEKEEGARSTLESPQDASQHPQKPQDPGSKEVQNVVDAAQQTKVPRCRRTSQRVEHHRVGCWEPGLGCAQRYFAKSAQRPQEVKKTQYKGVPSFAGKARSYLLQIASAEPQDSLCQ